MVIIIENKMHQYFIEDYKMEDIIISIDVENSILKQLFLTLTLTFKLKLQLTNIDLVNIYPILNINYIQLKFKIWYKNGHYHNDKTSYYKK